MDKLPRSWLVKFVPLSLGIDLKLSFKYTLEQFWSFKFAKVSTFCLRQIFNKRWLLDSMRTIKIKIFIMRSHLEVQFLQFLLLLVYFCWLVWVLLFLIYLWSAAFWLLQFLGFDRDFLMFLVKFFGPSSGKFNH